MPTLKIFAPSQAKNIVNKTLTAIDAIISKKDGTATLILINISVGVNNGNNEVITTNGVLGF